MTCAWGRLGLLVATAGVVACASSPTLPPKAQPGSGRIIGADQIQRWNVVDALEVVERIGGYTVVEGRGGRASIHQRRGQNSIVNAAATPVIVVDGVREVNPNLLRQIRANSILSIEVLTGNDATVRYGTGAASGAIIITTRGF